MNHPLVSLAAVILAGVCLIAYLLGFHAGRAEGHDEGHKKGKKEGAVRAFAVGYDRGKRERAEDEEPQKGDRPSIMILLLIVIGTLLLLTVIGLIRQSS